MNGSTTIDHSRIEAESLTYGLSKSPMEEEFNVFDSTTATILGEEADLYVIGSSHYIETPTLSEVFTCSPISSHETDLLNIDIVGERVESGSSFMVDEKTAVKVNLVVNFHPMKTYLKGYHRRFEDDLLYEFDEDAYTSVNVFSGDETTTWLTWHTYPEYDTAIHTKTEAFYV